MLGIMKISDKHETPFDTFDCLRQEGGVLCNAMRYWGSPRFANVAKGWHMLREGSITDKTDLRDRQ